MLVFVFYLCTISNLMHSSIWQRNSMNFCCCLTAQVFQIKMKNKGHLILYTNIFFSSSNQFHLSQNCEQPHCTYLDDIQVLKYLTCRISFSQNLLQTKFLNCCAFKKLVVVAILQLRLQNDMIYLSIDFHNADYYIYVFLGFCHVSLHCWRYRLGDGIISSWEIEWQVCQIPINWTPSVRGLNSEVRIWCPDVTFWRLKTIPSLEE